MAISCVKVVSRSYEGRACRSSGVHGLQMKTMKRKGRGKVERKKKNKISEWLYRRISANNCELVCNKELSILEAEMTFMMTKSEMQKDAVVGENTAHSL